jgi:hypothetical protein
MRDRFFFAISEGHAKTNAKPVKYSTRTLESSDNNKMIKSISIQRIEIESVIGMDAKSIKNINSSLRLVVESFKKEAQKCGAAAQGRPWNYESKFEKALLSEKFVSFVFLKSTVCAGSPDIGKESRVFALNNGNLVRGISLVKEVFPSAKILLNVASNRDLVRLDEETAEIMIDDSKMALNNVDGKCEFFLKNTSYKVWLDGKNLVLFPEYVQPNSFCQKEYIIQIAE